MQVTSSSLTLLLFAVTASCQQDISNQETDSQGTTATHPWSFTPFIPAPPPLIDANFEAIGDASSPATPNPSVTPAPGIATNFKTSIVTPAAPTAHHLNPRQWRSTEDKENTVMCRSRARYDVRAKPFNLWTLHAGIHYRWRHKFEIPVELNSSSTDYEIIPRTYRVHLDTNIRGYAKDGLNWICDTIRARNFGEVRPDLVRPAPGQRIEVKPDPRIELRPPGHVVWWGVFYVKADDPAFYKIIRSHVVVKIQPLFNKIGEPLPNDWVNQHDDKPLEPVVRNRPLPGYYPGPTLI
ncbi:hypothetical protein CORC01_11289 [Colletotrichum orchidophilum]|uniref:Uncharacterized protein n=1 Tax=Colletotrichum orchidophilum TaxID=1209926 RepID=A0A1G4AWA8_9PEZI|nr:uncharacterized protein CORC01_11289 [Colletotrichum orchidophilum]OHE93424.1 hypothetical protein CORC01_11289 [Colletotrichum orchidophilum]